MDGFKESLHFNVSRQGKIQLSLLSSYGIAAELTKIE